MPSAPRQAFFAATGMGGLAVAGGGNRVGATEQAVEEGLQVLGGNMSAVPYSPPRIRSAMRPA